VAQFAVCAETNIKKYRVGNKYICWMLNWWYI